MAVRYELFVNGNPVVIPAHAKADRTKALDEAEKFARRNRSVTLARVVADDPPVTVASWMDGVRNR